MSTEAPKQETPEEKPMRGPFKRIRAFLKRHHAKLWWLHSAYALALGALVATFAQKGFENARLLVIMVIVTWVLVVLLFRFFGEGSERKLESTGKKVRFYVMTYFLKNLYQGMLFFLLPFYWKSATLGEANGYFLILLCLCAFLSTMDIVFDQFLMKWRLASSVYYGLTLFAAMNLAIPAIFPMAEVLHTLLGAAGTTVIAFWAFHFGFKQLKKPVMAGIFVAVLGSGVGAAYLGRTAIPPVPMYLEKGAVGPEVLDDGRLAFQTSELNVAYVKDLHAVTYVAVPGGGGQDLIHEWTHDGALVASEPAWIDDRVRKGGTVIRLRSRIKKSDLPKDTSGIWHVDVKTDAGQLVGRIQFTVFK